MVETKKQATKQEETTERIEIGSIGLTAPKPVEPRHTERLETVVNKKSDPEMIMHEEESSRDEEGALEETFEDLFEAATKMPSRDERSSGDFYGGGTEEKSAGDFYGTGQENTQMYETREARIGGGRQEPVYDDVVRINPRERAWVDNRNWNEQLGGPMRDIQGNAITNRDRVQGETLAPQGQQDGFSTMKASDSYDSKG